MLTQNAIRTAPGAVLGPGRRHTTLGAAGWGCCNAGEEPGPNQMGPGGGGGGAGEGAREVKGLKGERTVRSYPQRGEAIPERRDWLGVEGDGDRG